MPAPVLDGTATGIASTTTTVSAALTTTSTNDIICALVCIEQNAAALWITGVSGGGLTWNKRTQATKFPSALNNVLGNAIDVELWWALAPTALSAVTITATANGTFDDAAILLFGVSGCNTTNPWDANASALARQVGVKDTTTPSITGISTTQANDFLIFAWGSNGSNTIGTVPAGFTAIGNRVNNGGVKWASVGAAYKAVTAATTNQSYAWGSAMNGFNTAIFDVLTADTGGSTTSPRPTWEAIASNGIATTNTISLSTAGITANDVLVLLSYCEQTGGGPAITGISGGGLTWARRSRSNSSAVGSLEVWYAQVTGTLAVSMITVAYAATADNIGVAVLSVAGCGSAVWDANGGLPAKASNTVGGASWTPSVTVSTSQAHDLILAVPGIDQAVAGLLTGPSGYQVLTSLSAGVSLVASLSIATQSRSTTQSGVAVAWGASLADQSPSSGEYIVDALTADAVVAAFRKPISFVVS